MTHHPNSSPRPSRPTSVVSCLTPSRPALRAQPADMDFLVCRCFHCEIQPYALQAVSALLRSSCPCALGPRSGNKESQRGQRVIITPTKLGRVESWKQPQNQHRRGWKSMMKPKNRETYNAMHRISRCHDRFCAHSATKRLTARARSSAGQSVCSCV